MSKNCLVTKLKGVVDNDELLKIGYKRFTLDFRTDQSVLRICLQFRSQQIIKVKGNAYFTDSTGEQNYGKSLTVDANISQTYTYVYVKDAVAEEVQVEINVAELAYFNNMSTLPDSRIKVGDLSFFNYATRILGIRTKEGMTTGSLPGNVQKSIAYMGLAATEPLTTEQYAQYTNLIFSQNNSFPVSGNIENLVSLSKISTLKLNYPGSTLSGEVNTLIQGLIANGLANGNKTFAFNTSGTVTLNGSALANENVTVNVTSNTQYSVTCNSVTSTYKKIDGNWVLQS